MYAIRSYYDGVVTSQIAGVVIGDGLCHFQGGPQPSLRKEAVEEFSVMLIENRTLQLSIVIFKSVQAMGRGGEYSYNFV